MAAFLPRMKGRTPSDKRHILVLEAGPLMRNMRQLIVDARRAEQAGNLKAALDLYREALRRQENSAAGGDLALYNRLGDLYLRYGDPGSAVEWFERAIDRYQEQQLYANAIALCKKILRNAPGHAEAHRRAGRLLALAGQKAEARTHYIEYADRMERDGSLGRALEALKEFADLSGDEEIRLALADRFLVADRTDEALGELRHVWRARRERGGDAPDIRRRMLTIDPAADPLAGADAGGGEPATQEGTGEGTVEATTGAAGGNGATRETGAPPGAAAGAGADGTEARVETAGPGPDGTALDNGAPGEPDMEALAAELQDVLNRLEGEERLRQALPVLDQLLRLEPDKVNLLLRKLEYALALGDESRAIEAYLALGDVLNRRLSTFSLRFLSSSSRSEGVTTAITVEERSAHGAGVE